MTTEGASRAVVFAATRRPASRRIDTSFRLLGSALLEDAADALGRPVASLVSSHADAACCAEVLSDVADQCVERARLTGCMDEKAARALYELALRLQDLALAVQDEELADHGRRLASVGEGLGRLRGVSSVETLIESACEEVATRCDFLRVVISRVEGASWMPSRAYFADADDSWFASWIEAGIPLAGSTPEARLLTERAPAVVYDTAATTVHREIIVESGQSASYVVAPLLLGNRVLGFLHADHFPTARQVDEADRDVLGTFADGFTRIHRRLVQLEQLEAQRNQVKSALDAVTDLGGDEWAAPARVPARPDLVAELTAREVEVLEMIVQGATNRAIGARLVIAEDTVKSHVKQILRKLGVANRAQAIASVAGTSLR